MGVVAKIALVLCVDGLARWVIGALVTLICVGLLVALIVVQTVAILVTGGQGGEGVPANVPLVASAAVRPPEPTL